MAFPTAVVRSPAIAIEGMLADTTFSDVLSKVAKAATLAPGRCVRIDNADNQDLVTIPTAAAQVTGDATNAPPVGVTICDVTNPANPYVAGDPVPVLRIGKIYVVCETVVNPSLPVYIRHTANGGNTIVGGFSAVAGTGLSLAPAGFRWLSTTTATTALAVLAVNMP